MEVSLFKYVWSWWESVQLQSWRSRHRNSAIDVTKRGPFSELVILCSDTDVLLILLHYFESLCSSTIFKTVNREFVLRKIHNPSTFECLQGFVGFPRDYQTGRFLGYTKLSCWKTFLLVDDVIQGFSQLGSSSQLTSDVLKSLEKYIEQLYCRNKVPQYIQSLADLRW